MQAHNIDSSVMNHPLLFPDYRAKHIGTYVACPSANDREIIAIALSREGALRRSRRKDVISPLIVYSEPIESSGPWYKTLWYQISDIGKILFR